MNKLLVTIGNNWVVLTLISLICITVLSLSPLKELPPVPGTDKTHHLVAYGVLMFPAALRRPRGWIAVTALFVVYGGLIELIQPYVNRHGEWLDFAANATGVLCGLILAGLAKRFISDEFNRS